MLVILYVTIISTYLLVIGFGLYHWNRIKEIKPIKTDTPEGLLISVVIVVRNEEGNVKDLLKDLALQSISVSAFEVLVVNDHSTDKTCQYIQEVSAQLPYKLKLLHLTSETGKKAGLELGIKNAGGKVISVTDGDCRVPTGWLLVIANAFLRNSAVFTSGPVTFAGERNLYEKIQTIEFASLVGSGAAMLHAGIPGMCNAANMAFSKKVYNQVNAFISNRHVPSGDDEFLLQAIYKRYPKKVFYLKSNKAVVSTKAQLSLHALYHQRKRWAGKWRIHKNFSVAITALAVFAFHASFLVLFLAVVTNLFLGHQSTIVPSLYFFVATLLKFGAEFLFLRTIMRSLGKNLLIIPFLALQLLYPFYVLFFGIAVNFGSFSWKGRTYKYTNT